MLESNDMVADIFKAAVTSVDPYRLVAAHSKEINEAFARAKFRRMIVAGFGKASCPMACAMEDALFNVDYKGVAITKYGHCDGYDLKKISMHEAGHPLPDMAGLNGTKELINSLRNADEQSLVVCLISGGGSALLVCPYEGVSLADKQYMTDLLLKAGADIYDLNTVRKHISMVKGGRLASIAYPAEIKSLIISDVIGDDLGVIASGPTSPDRTTFSNALDIIAKHDLLDKSPASVIALLGKGADGDIPETPKEGSRFFERVSNLIIGNNIKALKAARDAAEALGLEAQIISSELKGEARSAAKWLAQKAITCRHVEKSKKSVCLISGGETTVAVKGNGLGGRNTEFALAFALEIDGVDGITLLSAGTDGTDGATDAAGAVVDASTVSKARACGIDALAYLSNNDSYNFFQKAGGLFITGPTGTNVADIQIAIIEGRHY
ncbi:MAG TPA: glycerate kinase [Dissulfurispiraceae bacterium]|nr:glycerate kinase [Dissulfurispiraceae bacterium]